MTGLQNRRWAARLGAVVATIALTSCSAISSPAPHQNGAVPVAHGSLRLLTEIYGDSGQLLEQRLHDTLANGAGLHPQLSARLRRMVGDGRRPFAYYAIPDQAGVSACYPNSSDPDAAKTLRELGVNAQSQAWRLALPEFDQSGGCWAQGRPNPAGLGDGEAYAAWTQFYLDTKALRPDLEQTAERRGYKWMSVCVYAFCPQYAYDLGSDTVLLERNIDELSAMSPGLAMVRGAARQNAGREWGIDVSSFRYWNGGPTAFDDTGKLVTGWSPATFERTLYAAYMGGADVILNEAANYGTGAGDTGRNPLGAVVGGFADFSLRRHPDRGEPVVPMAILQDHFSGFEPRYGEFDQLPLKWYRQNPYTPGDKMLSGLLDVAFPGHETWGTIVPTAPWRVTAPDGTVDVRATQAAYRRALAAPGADPRTWEPMGATRWGESVDVITDHARLEALRRYRVVVLATTGPLSGSLRDDLTEYARLGGTVVVNATQLGPGTDPLTGFVVSAQRRSADSVTWSGGDVVAEKPFNYVRAEPDSDVPAGEVDVVGTANGGDPVFLRRKLGDGAVVLVTADRLLDAEGRGVLSSGRRLLDELYYSAAPVRVDGPPLQYLVSKVGKGTTVTLINTDTGGSTWRGRLHFRSATASAAVDEWTSDTPVPSTVHDGEVVVDAVVPPFGVRVFAMRPES